MYSADVARRYLKVAQIPIGKDDYAGADVRYSPEFEALEVELAKSASLHESSPIDWQKVQECSEGLLKNASKDLRVACWLTWALYQTQSFKGLVAGLAMLGHFFEWHWADIHPHKSRTRAAALGWLFARVDKALDANVPVKEQLELFRQLLAHLKSLDITLAEHLVGDAPLILPLCRRLANMIERAADHCPQQGPVQAVVTQVRQVATHWLSGVATIENDRDAQQALRAQKEHALGLCSWWSRQKATDLRALRLNRALMWLSINTLPQHNSERITELRGPAADKLKSYASQFEQGQFADLLVELEVAIARAPFWLNGQRLVRECLSALDADMAGVEVEVHLALFLKRLPGIVELRFHDGSEFADSATRSWIALSVMAHLEPLAAPPPSDSHDTVPAWDMALHNQSSTLRKEGLKPAVQALKRGLESAQGGRERFFWQFSLARLCHQAKKYELAAVQLEALDVQLQGSGLELWEPTLALQVLQLMHRCYESLPQGHAVRERKDEIYRRLCHLDLEVVLE